MAIFHLGEKGVETTGPLHDVRVDLESGATSLSLDKDIAIGLVGEHARDIDPEVEKRVLRKIDLFLIPAMIVGEFSFFFYEGARSYRVSIQNSGNETEGLGGRCKVLSQLPEHFARSTRAF